MTTCPTCDGFGYLGDGESEDDTEECPTCGGDGVVDDDPMTDEERWHHQNEWSPSS